MSSLSELALVVEQLAVPGREADGDGTPFLGRFSQTLLVLLRSGLSTSIDVFAGSGRVTLTGAAVCVRFGSDDDDSSSILLESPSNFFELSVFIELRFQRLQCFSPEGYHKTTARANISTLLMYTQTGNLIQLHSLVAGSCSFLVIEATGFWQ